MEKKLFEVARDFNVSKDAIVLYLNEKGYAVENRPIARISDEMIDVLSKKFQESLTDKKKAEQLATTGTRPASSSQGLPPSVKKEATLPPLKRDVGSLLLPVKEPPPPPVAVAQPPSLQTAPREDVPPEAPEQAVKNGELQITGSNRPQFRVLGKIDLTIPAKKIEEPKVTSGGDQSRPADPNARRSDDRRPADPNARRPADPNARRPDDRRPADPNARRPDDRRPADPNARRQDDRRPADPNARRQDDRRPADPNARRQDDRRPADPNARRPDDRRPADPNARRQDDRRPLGNQPVAPQNQSVRNEVAPQNKPVDEKPPVAPDENITDRDIDPVPEFHKMDAPQLKGLNIQGKIDLNQFNDRTRSGAKKTPPPPVRANGDRPAGTPQAAGQTGAPRPPSTDQSEDARRRRRRRTKIRTAPPASPQQPGTGTGASSGTGTGAPRTGTGTPQPPRPGMDARRPVSSTPGEISKKEIDEKIKATMARLNVTTKGRGQKMRRDKRDRFREREELAQQAKGDAKLQVAEFISVSDLASLLGAPVGEVIMTCMNLGIMVSINQRLDAEIIEVVAGEFGHAVEFISAEEQVGDTTPDEIDLPEDLVSRAPIVTVMGHVDHGKTSLLDYIRKTNVVSSEAGGITQHIGAYEVKLPDGKKITFLDTPGHEAFTAMRARGAKVTDIAVIIIAADDNIMPQTKEAISHAQAAGVQIIFAINKIDKPGADPERIKQELASMNFLVEDWGGKYQSQDISAKQGIGIDKLMEKILLEAELLDLKANPNKKAVGTLIEASLDKGKGYVSKLLVQAGTLRQGDAIVAGEHSGKVKAMFNELGKKITKAGPATPVLVLGLSGAPQAGEKFKVLENESEAREIASKRAQIIREQNTRASKRISLEEIGRRLALGTFKELNLIIKGDFDGSVEALADSLIKQSQETVQVRVIHKAVGQIIESDVNLASASDAIIIGFQVRPSAGARVLAEREGVEIKLYSIIYEAIEEIRTAIEGLLEPTKEEKIIAQVEVREVYKISKVGTVAGCYVNEGKITRNTLIRIIRDGIVVFPVKEGGVGELSSLKRFKDDMKEVKAGFECGLTIKGYNDISVGDTIEGYEIIEIKQKLAAAR